MARRSASVSLPAPGRHRSMTNLGMDHVPSSRAALSRAGPHGVQSPPSAPDTMTRTPDDLTASPQPDGTDLLLADVLAQLRLDSAIFLRAEYGNPWAYESPSCADLCAVLRPGAVRLVLFHIVALGRCWIEVEGEQRIE